MRRLLKIYTFIDEVKSIPFPNKENQLEIGEYSFTSSRSNNIPKLSAKVFHNDCLDELWDYRQYVEFNGEKYWVASIPSSKKNNTDCRYEHNIEFSSHRAILFNTYFYDVVNSTNSDITIGNKYCSNSSNVLFYGTLRELASRLNASLSNSKLPYRVYIDNDIEKADVTKQFSCNDTFIGDALKKAFDVYDVPFYFNGYEIHFGYYSNYLSDYTFEYGGNNSLLSIERNNANQRLITRATGIGSSDNIPFYYPNDSEKGNIKFNLYDKDENDITNLINIIDANKIATHVTPNTKYTYSTTTKKAHLSTGIIEYRDSRDQHSWNEVEIGDNVLVEDLTEKRNVKHDYRIFFSLDALAKVSITMNLENEEYGRFFLSDSSRIILYKYNSESSVIIQNWYGTSQDIVDSSEFLEAGEYYFQINGINVSKPYPLTTSYEYTIKSLEVNIVEYEQDVNKWVSSQGNITSLREIGISYNETINDLGNSFEMQITELLPFQTTLMPSIFSRGSAFNNNIIVDSLGYERFYDAINGKYFINNERIEFANPINIFNKSEKKYTFEDIKPEINGVTNAHGELICEIIDVAYDDNDSDAVDDDSNYIHPYFYVKLRVFDGDMGFNLFDHAIESDEMTLQITSGNLNGCKFKVQAIEKTYMRGRYFLNPVQVDKNGDIVKGDYQQKININNIQESQQDTRNSEVWIALLKENSTFGVIMPNVAMNYRMQIGDTFNIINILLPKGYILSAEKRLDNAIVKNLLQDNKEIFNYSIDFSRIFLARDYENNLNNSVISLLNEASKLDIIYNGKKNTQYVTSYTYQSSNNDALPNIKIELEPAVIVRSTYSDDLLRKASQNSNNQIAKNTKPLAKTSAKLEQQVASKATKATTLDGYGITDANITEDGTIVLGNTSIQPITKSGFEQQENINSEIQKAIQDLKELGLELKVTSSGEKILVSVYNFASKGNITAGVKSPEDSDTSNPLVASLGDLVNIDSKADELSVTDKILVKLANQTHWTLAELADLVGLDVVALNKYLLDNDYIVESDLEDAMYPIQRELGNKFNKSQVGELFEELSSNKDNAISIKIGGTTKTISKSVLMQALELDATITNLQSQLENADRIISSLTHRIVEIEDLGFKMGMLSDGSRVLITPHNFTSEGQLTAGGIANNAEVEQRIVILTEAQYQELVETNSVNPAKIYYVY